MGYTKKQYREMFSRPDWDIEVLEAADVIIGKVAKEYLNLDIYPNQFEIVTAEQLLDVYSSIGLPTNYPHWKFGKDFMGNQSKYKRGQMGLSYELVINSNPCISYNLEDNTLCMMMLVMAHAAQGHNSFFKNNYMFKQWTDAEGIVDYMVFARDYILKCEEKYGPDEVEWTLDACHTIQRYGIDKYVHPPKMTAKKEKERLKKALKWDDENYNDLWKTVPRKLVTEESDGKGVSNVSDPQENILFFIEKNAPTLPQWKRELVRIVRKVAQYFYPQSQTKMINEGWATFSHYMIINKMYDEGYLPDGFMIEFFKSHSAVVYQPEYNSKYFSGLNPYTLGFNIFMDIKRICENPTKEDKEWFPDIAGTEWKETILDIVDNYRDESFILQFMSPKVIRDFKFFLLEDSAGVIEFQVSAIHNINGYKRIRKELARQQEYNHRVPNIQIVDCDLIDTRDLILGYKMSEGKELHEKDMDQVLLHVKQIWGYDIILELWKDDEKIGQKSTDPEKVETVKKSTANNPFAYGMFMGGHV